jgi:hypothetical protein
MSPSPHWSETPRLSRRAALKAAAAGVIGQSLSGWLGRLAALTAAAPQRKRSCILLWMAGGPSQLDTFDLKPGHANGGPCKEIVTKAPGIKISEHLPRLARHTDRMAIIRSMHTKVADHELATHLLHTGHAPQGVIQHPSLAALLTKELGDPEAALPGAVYLAPSRLFTFDLAGYGAGFLGPKYTPLVLGDSSSLVASEVADSQAERILRVPDLASPDDVSRGRLEARQAMLEDMHRDFARRHPGLPAQAHQSAYQRARRLMSSTAWKAFDLEGEPKKLRDEYGRNLFGYACLLARRLVEHGVPFVEVTLGGWDTHTDNFASVRRLSGALDGAWAALLEDLKQRGMLDSTLVVWMGEFGRTPKINKQNGRDHWANGWTTVLAGGGIRGGQVIGRTSPDGLEVTERPVAVADLLATVCLALGVDPAKQNTSNTGRPIRIVESSARPVREALS